MNGEAMMISALVIYAIVYAFSFVARFIRFPPIVLLNMLAAPVLKIFAIILFIWGAYTTFKNQSKFTAVCKDNEKEIK
jgi:hypothetical protein